jgi:futalosine hydrolase
MPQKNVLIVVATKEEIQPMLDSLAIITSLNTAPIEIGFKTITLTILITGVGLVNTAYALGRLPNKAFTHCINVGIAGSFDFAIELGETVLIVEDELSELGAEAGDNFLKWEELQLGGTSVYKASGLNTLPICLNTLKHVKSISVNTVHGNEATILKTKQLFSPQTESMEGAAFFRACEHLSGVHWQVRTVSNYVEVRDKTKWKIGLAIKNLNELLAILLHELEH